jgi:hypothetical protein
MGRPLYLIVSKPSHKEQQRASGARPIGDGRATPKAQGQR